MASSWLTGVVQYASPRQTTYDGAEEQPNAPQQRIRAWLNKMSFMVPPSFRGACLPSRRTITPMDYRAPLYGGGVPHALVCQGSIYEVTEGQRLKYKSLCSIDSPAGIALCKYDDGAFWSDHEVYGSPWFPQLGRGGLIGLKLFRGATGEKSIVRVIGNTHLSAYNFHSSFERALIRQRGAKGG